MANPKIGFLHSGSEKAHVDNVSAFHRGLAEAGYVDDDDVDVSYGWADDDATKLVTLAAQFVTDRVKVIVAAGGPKSAEEAQKATRTTRIPIVFTTVSDPRRNGLVKNYDEPEDNLTGTAGLTSELDPKRLEILRELMPTALNIGVLRNPNRPKQQEEYAELEAAAAKLAPLNLIPKSASNPAEIDAAFNDFDTPNVQAVLVTADQLFNNRRKKVVKRARQIKKPAIYQWRDFVEVRGLMSYGPNIKDAYYQTGVYVGRILDGEKVARLPVVFPDKFELVINLRTANKLEGLTIPASLLTRAILVRHP